MQAENLYDIQNLTHRYGRGPATLDIDALRIEEGSVTGLVGPNGSGKSTLLKVLAFLEPPTSGKIFFDGADSAGRESALRRSVTYLLQDSYLLKRTVYENIAYGLKLRGETNEIEARVFDALRRVGLEPDDFAKRPWYRLSGGEVQRAALASRLALHPRVLLLDEPTANVDESSAILVKDAALSAWREWGTTVVVATHDLVWLYEVSSDIVSLYGGRIVGRGAENLIQGPWKKDGGFACRTTSDGQVIRGESQETGRIAAGILNPSEVQISRTPLSPTPEKNALRGVISQMTLERGTGGVLVSIDIDGLILKSRVQIGQVEKESIYPSAEIWISFSADKIRWLKDK